MKHKLWMHQLISALFAFVLAVSSVGNLITGYGLPVDGMWKIWLWCAVAAIAMAVLVKLPHGGKIMLGLAALATLGFSVAEWIQPTLQKQIPALLYRITSHYHDVYNWPILGRSRPGDVAIPLILWGFLVAFCVNWYFCRRKHILLAIVPTVIPLVLCLLTADKIPEALYPYLMILGLGALLVTDWTRKHQPEQSIKLTVQMVLPLTLVLALLFVINPQTSYVNRAGKIQKTLFVWLEDIQDLTTSVMTGTPVGGSTKKVNLQMVGSKSNSTRSVMVVRSPVDGMLYLRERDYDVYTGTTWEASADRKEKFTAGTSTESLGTLTILTYSTRSTRFIPYYATQGIVLEGGALENNESYDRYKYVISRSLSQKTSLPDSRYKELPAETKAWAKKLAQEIIGIAKSDAKKIALIQDYVQNAAKYDTNAKRMGSSGNDFAQWFLESCETGYCVHYATAATVLLRAVGIPARYVEGYAINCEAGVDAVVSKLNAHAWVEYYDASIQAWCVLEVTPGHDQPEKPETLGGSPMHGVEVPGNNVDTPEENKPADDSPGDIPDRLPQWDELEEPTEADPPEERPEEEEKPTEETPTEPTVVPEETEPPKGSADGGVTQIGKTVPPFLRKLIKIVSACLLAVLGIWLQGYLRVLRKRKLWNRGEPNAITIWRWRQTRSAANLLNQYYPEELDDLAKKARFSQHEIQPDELQLYEDYRLTVADVVLAKPWYQRWFWKWILAIDCK